MRHATFRRLRLEILEDRSLLSATPLSAVAFTEPNVVDLTLVNSTGAEPPAVMRMRWEPIGSVEEVGGHIDGNSEVSQVPPSEFTIHAVIFSVGEVRYGGSVSLPAPEPSLNPWTGHTSGPQPSSVPQFPWIAGEDGSYYEHIPGGIRVVNFSSSTGGEPPIHGFGYIDVVSGVDWMIVGSVKYVGEYSDGTLDLSHNPQSEFAKQNLLAEFDQIAHAYGATEVRNGDLLGKRWSDLPSPEPDGNQYNDGILSVYHGFNGADGSFSRVILWRSGDVLYYNVVSFGVVDFLGPNEGWTYEVFAIFLEPDSYVPMESAPSSIGSAPPWMVESGGPEELPPWMIEPQPAGTPSINDPGALAFFLTSAENPPAFPETRKGEISEPAILPDVTVRPVTPNSRTNDATEEASDTTGTAEGYELADELLVAVDRPVEQR